MNAPDSFLARDYAAPGTGAATRTVAVVFSRKGDCERVGAAFAAEAWGQVHSFSHPDGLLRALALGLQVDLIVMGLYFPGLDGLGLLRELSRCVPAPAVHFYSYQQRAVQRAAGALAQALGLRYLGCTDATTDARELVRTLDDAWPKSTRLYGAQARPPLVRSELRGLLDQQRMRAYLQPKVRIDSGEVTGFEVLMRATGPDGQLITPDRLIEPLAQSGWLCEATRQLFVPALDVLGECLSAGFPVSISFNASLGLIALPGFGAALARQVEMAGLDPSWITIEITETEAMSSPIDVMEHTARIRMEGFNLSIDDFGTSYSSFLQLSQLPFSELKIERTFVSGLDQAPIYQAIVGTCATLGNRLGLSVVAEGVETPAELAAVRAAGCTHVQGYLFARPMPSAEVRNWLLANQGQVKVPA